MCKQKCLGAEARELKAEGGDRRSHTESQLPVDCDKSKTGTINPKPTTRMIEQSYS